MILIMCTAEIPQLQVVTRYVFDAYTNRNPKILQSVVIILILCIIGVIIVVKIVEAALKNLLWLGLYDYSSACMLEPFSV